MLVSRRNILRSMLAAPAIIAADKLMKVQRVLLPEPKLFQTFTQCEGKWPNARVLSIQVSSIGNGVMDVGVVDMTGKESFLLAQQRVTDNGTIFIDQPLVLRPGDRLFARASGDMQGIASVQEHSVTAGVLPPQPCLVGFANGRAFIA